MSGEGSVEIAAGPVRYPVAPLLALVVIALVPTIALAVLYRGADRRADEYDAQQAGEVDEDPTADAVEIPGATRLATPVLAARRTPSRLLQQSNVASLQGQVEPLLGFVDDRSCAVVSVDDTVIAATNESTPVIPASLVKLVTAAVALEKLGGDATFVTTVSAPGPIDGAIDGDVYLVGGGDPMLRPDDAEIDGDSGVDAASFETGTSLDPLADALVALGVTRIRGSVVADGGRYDDEWTVDSWADGAFGDDVGPIGALLVNDGRVLGRSERQRNPGEAAAREFVRLLGNRGIQVDGGVDVGPADPAVPVVGEVRSAPLTDIVGAMLRTSDNDTAEMLLKEIGFVTSGAGTRVAGLNAVDATLRAWGVPSDGVRLLDGSGLSPTNRLTCAAVQAVLRREDGGPIPRSLPVAARSGTLADEFLESPMVGVLAAKTGTLENAPADAEPPAAKGLAGYVPLDDGATITFTLILNTPDVDRREAYGPLWAAFGERFATYPERTDSLTFGPEPS